MKIERPTARAKKPPHARGHDRRQARLPSRLGCPLRLDFEQYPAIITPKGLEPMHRQQHVIVVTGGPGGGKTTALDLFQRELKSAVKVVPEAATMLFGHGLDREAGNADGKLLQRSIYRMQLSLEGIFREFYSDRLLICDRGTLDGLAYWPDDEQSFLEGVGSTFEAELARYNAVIFFQTAAVHGEDVKSNNPYRTENSRTAVALDEKLKRVWSRHAHFHFIPAQLSFMAKINHGLETIAGVLKQMPA